jgi:hypothetical protein
MASRSDDANGLHSQEDLRRRFKRSLRWTIVSAVVFVVTVVFAVYISNGMPGHALWNATRIPTTLVAGIAAIALAFSGSRTLWARKELNSRSR